MIDAVRQMLKDRAREDYLREVERRKTEERELEAEINRRKSIDKKRKETNIGHSNGYTEELG